MDLRLGRLRWGVGTGARGGGLTIGLAMWGMILGRRSAVYHGTIGLAGYRAILRRAGDARKVPGAPRGRSEIGSPDPADPARTEGLRACLVLSTGVSNRTAM